MYKILIALFFTSCLFVPEIPETPIAEYLDQLALTQIMNGTGYSFNYGGYDELFSTSKTGGEITSFIDISGVNYSRSRFISRLNSIISQYGDSVSVSWGNDGSGDFITETDSTDQVLSLRNYRASTPDGIFEGKVEVTVRYDGIFKWQIINWKEIENINENQNNRYSFFHPDFDS